MADKVSRDVDKITTNLTSMNQNQQVVLAEVERQRQNMATVKRILQQDGLKSLLTAQGERDVASIDVEPLVVVEKEQMKIKKEEQEECLTPPKSEAHVKNKQTFSVKGKMPRGNEDEKKASSSSTPTARQMARKEDTDGDKSKVKEEKQKVKKKEENESSPPPPPPKKPKKKSFDLEESESDKGLSSDDEEEAINIQPDVAVVLPATNSKGRRVYGIKGATDATLAKGSFLLYQLDAKKTVYSFNENAVKRAVTLTSSKYKVKRLAELAQKPSFREACCYFALQLINYEASHCAKPIFLDRAIPNSPGSDLRTVFNNIPEPVRSAIYKYCKDTGSFANVDKGSLDALAVEVNEVAQMLQPDVHRMRLGYPAQTLAEDFVHVEMA